MSAVITDIAGNTSAKGEDTAVIELIDSINDTFTAKEEGSEWVNNVSVTDSPVEGYDVVGNVLANDNSVSTTTVTTIIVAGVSYAVAQNGINTVITTDKGTLSINNTGKFTYDVNETYNESLNDGDTTSDTFTYVVNGDSTKAADLTINIKGTDDAPIINAASGGQCSLPTNPDPITEVKTLLLSESFENGKTTSDGWYVEYGNNGVFTGDHGVKWTLNSGGVEIQSGDTAGSTASDGDKHAELDPHGCENAKMTTTVNLGNNDSFELTFDYKPRPGSEDSSDMKVSFGGVDLTINSDSHGNLTFIAENGVTYTSTLNSNGWYTIDAKFSGLTGNTAELVFEGQGKVDTLGAFIDDIKLVGIDNIGSGTTSTETVTEVYYQSANAAYQNTLLVYDMENGVASNPRIILVDANDASKAGDLIATLDGTDSRFMIIADGATRFPSIATSNLAFVNNELTINGTKVSYVYYQDQSLNVDGYDHFYENADGSGFTIRIEDLQNGGDKDFDDLIITTKVITTTISSDNLIVNGSFEDVTGIDANGNHLSDPQLSSGQFIGMKTLTGWELMSSESRWMEVHESNHAGVGATDGENYLDLGESATISGNKASNYNANTHIGQVVNGVVDGNSYEFSFDYKDKAAMQESGTAGQNSGVVEVYWGGKLISTIQGNNTTNWETFKVTVIGGAGDGSNRIEFKEVGEGFDNWGIAIDNVSLVGLDTPIEPENLHIVSDINISDVDDANLESAKVVLTNYKAGDVIVVNDLPSGITATIEEINGELVVKLTGTATVSTYENAIESLTFNSTSVDVTPREFEINVNDGSKDSNIINLSLNVEGCISPDTVPTSVDETQNIVFETNSPITTNIIITLDISGSMTSNDEHVNRLALAKETLENIISEYDNYGDVNVKLVTFSDQGNASSWMNASDAIDYINSLSAGGWTNYEDALFETYNNYSEPVADQTVAYFISDGEPNKENIEGCDSWCNVGDDRESGWLDSPYVNAWNNFVDTYVDQLNVVAMGSGISDTTYLDVIAGVADGDFSNTIVVNDSTQLNDTLLGTVNVVETKTVSGNLLDNVDFNTDGAGGLVSIEIDGVIYTSTTFPTDGITTLNGGKLVFNFTSGDYIYTAVESNYTSDISETFKLVAIDSDDDTTTFNLTINVDVPEAPANIAPVAVDDCNLGLQVQGNFVVADEICSTISLLGEPDITYLTDGGYVVTWTAIDSNFTGIFAQKYDIDGDKIGDKIQVNTFEDDYQHTSHVTALANGSYLVTWTANQMMFEQGLDVNDQGSKYIEGQIFDANNNPVCSEFTVARAEYDPIIGLPDGGFIVTWSADARYDNTAFGDTNPIKSDVNDGSGYGIFGQRYDALGNEIGDAFQVNTFTNGNQIDSDITLDANGNVLVTWQSECQDGSDYGVYVQKFALTTDGVEMIGSETRVNSTTCGAQTDPEITALTNGTTVVTWESGSDVYAQVLDINGKPVDNSDLMVTNNYCVDGKNPVISPLGTGFIIVWQTSTYNIEAKTYDASGHELSNFVVTNECERETQPAVTTLIDGTFVVTWEVNNGVVAHRYNADGSDYVQDNMDVVEDGSLIIDIDTLLANDYDAEDGSSVTFNEISSTTNGTAVLINNGTQILFTPNFNYVGEAGFTYNVTDTQGLVSNEAKVCLTVKQAGEPTVFVGTLCDADIKGTDITVTEGEDLVFAVRASGIEVGNTITLTVADVSTNTTTPDYSEFMYSTNFGTSWIVLPSNGMITITDSMIKDGTSLSTILVKTTSIDDSEIENIESFELTATLGTGEIGIGTGIILDDDSYVDPGTGQITIINIETIFSDNFENCNSNGWTWNKVSGCDNYCDVRNIIDADCDGDKELFIKDADTVRGFVSQTLAGSLALTTYAISVDVDSQPKGTDSNNDAVGIVFAYKDDNNYYRVEWNDLDSNYSSLSTYRDFSIIKVENGVETTLASQNQLEIYNIYGTEFNLKVEVNEDGIGAFVNGDLIVSVAGVQPAMNTFGLWTDDNDSGIAYDNVKVETTSKIVIEESNDLNLDNIISKTNSKVDIIDITNNEMSNLRIDINDVIDLVDSDKELIIKGDLGDKVDLDTPSDWSNTGATNIEGINYNVYQGLGVNSTIKLLIEDDIDVTPDI